MILPIDTIAAILLILSMTERHQEMVHSLPYAAAWIASGAALVLLLSWSASRFCLLLMKRGTMPSPAKRSLNSILTIVLRILVVAIFGATTLAGDWPLAGAQALGGDENSLTLQLILGLAPYILYCLLSWICTYPVHVRASSGRWTRISYLVHKARYSLFILGLAIPGTLLLEYFSSLPEGEFSPITLQLGMYGMLIITAWVFPFFLRWLWGCAPLAEGPLRNRIHELESATGVRFSGIYVWDLGGGTLLNAAAVGIFPPFRYLFLSKALIDSMSPEEIDGVVCHEMGHVHHRHLLFYLLFTIAFMKTGETLFLAAPLGAIERAILTVLLLAVYVRFVFSFFSQRIERQADLYALETLKTATPLCDALERIGVLSGNVRNADSWHHLSIAERVSFLRAAEMNPLLAQAHHFRLRQLLGMASYIAVLMLTISFLTESAYIQPPPSPLPHSRQQSIQHWQHVRYLLPSDASAPLHLAESLLAQGDPATALRYATEARDLARSDKERREATRLIEHLVNQ